MYIYTLRKSGKKVIYKKKNRIFVKLRIFFKNKKDIIEKKL